MMASISIFLPPVSSFSTYSFLQNLLTNKWDFDGSKSIKQSHKIVSFKCSSKFHNQQKWTTKK